MEIVDKFVVFYSFDLLLSFNMRKFIYLFTYLFFNPWSFPGVWVTASLLIFPELFLVF